MKKLLGAILLLFPLHAFAVNAVEMNQTVYFNGAAALGDIVIATRLGSYQSPLGTVTDVPMVSVRLITPWGAEMCLDNSWADLEAINTGSGMPLWTWLNTPTPHGSKWVWQMQNGTSMIGTKLTATAPPTGVDPWCVQ